MTCLDPYLSMAATEVGLEPDLACCDRPRAILLGYLFGAFNLDQLQTRLNRTFGFSFERHIRKQMIADRDVMCGMKFSLYQTVAARHRYRTLPELSRYAVSVGLSEIDMPLVSLVLNHAGLSSHFDNLLASGNRAMPYERFRKEIDLAVAANETNTRKFAYAKLRFLSNWGIDVEDSITDCQSRAFEALLLQFPLFVSRQHFHNLYKLTIRQAGSKLIAHHTTQGRNVFDSEGQKRKSSTHAYASDGDGEFSILDLGEGVSSDMLGGLTGGDDSHEEATLQVHSLLTNPSLSPQDKQFLTLLAGETDHQFERWLTDQRQVQNVERVINAATPRYRRLVMEYLGYPSNRLKRIQHLLTNVRRRPTHGVIALPPSIQRTTPSVRPQVVPLKHLNIAPPVRY